MNEPRTGPLVDRPTEKRPGDLVLTSRGVEIVQADGSTRLRPPKR